MKLLNTVKLLGAVAVVAFAGSAAASVTVSGYHGTTTFTGAGAPSAHIVHVPAVPEADTWAMMAVGLGLVGLRLRRKAGKPSAE
ncbi:MAG: PEP-CTERM sorting domain-containing protein [Sulfuriferula sp.]